MNKKHMALSMLLILAVAIAPVLTAGAAPAGLTAQEQAVLSRLNYGNAWNQLAYLSSFPEKVTGTPQESAAQDYVYQQFLQMGLEVTRETFSTQSWNHQDESLKVITPLNEDVPVTTYGASYSVWGTDNGKPYAFGNRPGTISPARARSRATTLAR